MALPEFLVHRASLLRGFPDSGVLTDLLVWRPGRGPGRITGEAAALQLGSNLCLG